MPRYSEERKAAVLKKLLPPQNRSVVQVAAEEGISDVTPLTQPFIAGIQNGRFFSVSELVWLHNALRLRTLVLC